jgi:hypothetical protein
MSKLSSFFMKILFVPMTKYGNDISYLGFSARIHFIHTKTQLSLNSYSLIKLINLFIYH